MIGECGPVTVIEFVQKIQEMHGMRPHEDKTGKCVGVRSNHRVSGIIFFPINRQ